MAKFPEADKRLFQNKYVCRKCKRVVKAPSLLVSKGAVKCKKCQGKALRPKKKK